MMTPVFPEVPKIPAIILASASPRRREILEAHGVTPVIRPADVYETLPDDLTEEPKEAAMYLAGLKARAVYLHYYKNKNPEPAVILGADTIVYKDRIIGKPVDEADAFAILSSLRNARHSVITGVALIDAATGAETVFYEETFVTFNDYPDEEIRRFVREEPPYDKSGSYAIQSSWSKNVAAIDGDVENVIGLPWAKIAAYLQTQPTPGG
jgi:septum formation protein